MVCALSLSGCSFAIDRALDDPADAGGDAELLDADAADGGDAGGPDADGSDGDADARVPLVASHFAEPVGDVVVSSQAVPVRVVTSGGERVDIVVDGVVAANLQLPYEWSLTTAGLAPGEHTVTPRVIVGANSYDGTPFTLTVDRTPIEPATSDDIESATAGGLLPLRTPIVITFSEALAPSSISTLEVTASDSGVAIAGSLTIEGPTAVFTPTLPWRGTWARISLSGSVSDRAGNSTSVSAWAELTIQSYWARDTNSIGTTDVTGTVHETGDYLFVGRTQYWNDATLGAIMLVGRVRGASLPPPDLDPGFGSVRVVRSALDTNGAAYVVFEEVASGSGDSQMIVARFDPETRVWSKQVLAGPLMSGGVPGITIAGAGNVFVNYGAIENNATVYRRYYRGPEDASFAMTTDDPNPYAAYPGTSGRACALYISPAEIEDVFDYELRCVAGGAAPHTIPLTSAAYGVGASLRPNATGNGVIVVGREVYVFDGATETVSSPISTDAFYNPVGAVNALGQACVAYGHGSVKVRKYTPGAGFSEPISVSTPPLSLSDPQLAVAIDATGHCFVSIRVSDIQGTYIAHDATFDGLFSPPYRHTPGYIFAGAANQAFLLDTFLTTFTPLTP